MFKLYAKGTSSFDDITDYLSRDSLIIDEQLQEKANVCSFDMEANPVKEGQEIKIWDVVSVVDTTSLKTVKVDKLYDEVKKFRKGNALWLDINGANEEKVEIVSVNTLSNTINITTASNTHSIGSLVGIKKFAGNVSSVQNVNQHQLKNVAYFVKAFDYTKEFDRANINDSWRNKTAKEIIDEFVREKVNVGLTEQFTTSQVMTGSTFTKVSAPFTKPMELMRRLSGEEGFSWWIDYDKTIHYKPFLEEVAPFQITTVSNNFVDLKIDTDITMVKNRQIVLGGFEDSISDVAEFHKGDGTKREWVLRAKFSDLRIAIGTNSASMTTASVLPDNINEAGTADYFSNFTMQSVRADEATATLTTASLIRFLYKEKIPINVLDEDPASIASLKALGFADGVMEGRPIIDKSIKSRAEAQDIARAELLKYANPIINASFKTDINGLKTGQAIRIIDPFRNINDDFLIQRVREKVYAGDNSVIEATCASTLFGINELIRKLLENDSKIDLDDDITIDLVKLIKEELGFTSSWERKDDNVQDETIGLTSSWSSKQIEPPFVWGADGDYNLIDNFNRSDRELNADNYWTVRLATNGNATNGLMNIVSNIAVNTSTTDCFITRKDFISFPNEASIDFYNLGVGRKVDHILVLGSSNITSRTNFINNGIYIYLTRSSSAFNDSFVYIYDGTTVVASKFVGFQFNANFSVKIEIASDGSGTATLYNQAGLTGTSDSISWGARTWTNGGGEYSGFTLTKKDTDGAGESNERGADNFSLTGEFARPENVMVWNLFEWS